MKKQIEKMFNSIYEEYDFINNKHILPYIIIFI